jgi:hypothetical protein
MAFGIKKLRKGTRSVCYPLHGKKVGRHHRQSSDVHMMSSRRRDSGGCRDSTVLLQQDELIWPYQSVKLWLFFSVTRIYHLIARWRTRENHSTICVEPIHAVCLLRSMLLALTHQYRVDWQHFQSSGAGETTPCACSVDGVGATIRVGDSYSTQICISSIMLQEGWPIKHLDTVWFHQHSLYRLPCRTL